MNIPAIYHHTSHHTYYTYHKPHSPQTTATFHNLHQPFTTYHKSNHTYYYHTKCIKNHTNHLPYIFPSSDRIIFRRPQGGYIDRASWKECSMSALQTPSASLPISSASEWPSPFMWLSLPLVEGDPLLVCSIWLWWR